MSAFSLRLRGPAHRGATIVMALVLLFLALTLLTIGASSPYTHANLNAGYNEDYTRTEQILVGPAGPFGGLQRSSATSPDAVQRGEYLYVTTGCAFCHQLDGRGGPVGKPIAGAAPDLIAKNVRAGGIGMPPFAANGLTDAQIVDITAYLRSLPVAK